MQKVITVTSHCAIEIRNKGFYETEYPELDKYLKDGYRIIESIVVKQDAGVMYCITFILEK